MSPLSKPCAVFAFVLCAALAGFAARLAAQPVEAAKPIALRAVMDKLGRDMQAVTGAISIEDWARVAELAPQIASHDQPSVAQKMRILAWLGTDAARFRGFDAQVHDAASAMGEAAKREDGEAVIAAFSKTQQGCLACHRSFRRAFVEQFDRGR